MKKTLPYLSLLAMGLLFAFSAQAQTFVSVGVSQPAELAADAGSSTAICPGDSTSLGGTPAATGGTPSFTYSWSPSSGLSSASSANPMASPTASSSFVLSVTDARNCTSVDTVVITVDTCVGIPDPQLPFDLSIYPNPNDGNFRLSLTGNYNGNDLVLRVIDPRGKEIRRETLAAFQGSLQKEFTLNSFAAGIYFVELDSPEGRLVRRIMIR